MSNSQRPVLHFIYFDAGGGHRSAANALKAVAEQQNRPWDIRLINLQEVLDPLDIFRKYTRIRMQDVYNKLLAKGWTLGSAQLLIGMHGLIRLYHRGQVKLLVKFWQQQRPAMVVSLVPNFNRAMYQALQKVDSSIPYVTVITDFADYPPHFWIERDQQQHVVCGTEKAAQQARELGYRDQQITRTSGMILRPRFYEVPPIDRAAEREKQGLRADLPTGLVLFGGQGSSVMKTIANKLQNSKHEHQLILMCGRNEKLAAKLRELPLRNKPLVVTFTENVPYYMQMADFFIGKPGPGSISEAVAMGLPVIVERNAWTLPQERYNADWVRENEAGLVLNTFDEIGGAVEQLLSGDTLTRLQARVRQIHNRAVFEIVDLLGRMLP